jgi:hypothetical protein
MVSERRTFGERLKRHRERCGVSLESISQTTKVAASLFAGLERGDCSRWPAGLYSRAYVRAYAEAVGLNASDTVEEFSAVFGETPTAPAPPGVPTHMPASPGQMRLSIADDRGGDGRRTARRLALAASELVIGFLIAAIAHVGLGANAWVTTLCVLAYFGAGRALSDDPLLYWIYLRTRRQAEPAPIAESGQDSVHVGDTASTAA